MMEAERDLAIIQKVPHMGIGGGGGGVGHRLKLRQVHSAPGLVGPRRIKRL